MIVFFHNQSVGKVPKNQDSLIRSALEDIDYLMR